MRAHIAADRLRELLDYDPATGVFTWLLHRSNINAGDRAGHLGTRGYVQLRVDRRLYAAHRLAWLHVHGRQPIGDIDHINGDRNDNRIANLREATRAENLHNRAVTDSFGVSVVGSRWKSRIRANGKAHHLGYFDTRDEAHQAYVAAKRQFHPTWSREEVRHAS